MITSCCVSVPHPHGSFEVLPKALSVWQERLQAGLGRVIKASDQSMGHLEEEILQKTKELERTVLEEASQKKADLSPPVCPVCKNKLSRVTHGHERSYQTRFGEVRIRRDRGWCRKCKSWRFPADHALGLSEAGSCSPSVQEMAALAVSKLPVSEASAVIERLTGVKLPRATLDREARRQGKKAENTRQELDEQMHQGTGAEQQVEELRLKKPLEPFTLVIELDAWNIRERNDEQWGQTEALRKAGQEPEWWHWVYGGTCFRLSQRAKTAGGRSLILSRGTVMTRGGIDALRQQLWAEAMRYGLGQAERNYLENNRNRLDYKGAKERGEPLGSGAMESTCKQYQVRFHRSGQFWTRQGDEALMCLETFWRNARWSLLFPHVPPDFDPSKN